MVYNENTNIFIIQEDFMKFLGNFLWFLLHGLWFGLLNFVAGIIACVTIIGIPFGIACFRIAKLTFFPFGKTVTTDYDEHPAGNVIWLVLGGASSAVSYAILGALCCVTLIGLPFGKQCFKLMKLSAIPFGATVTK